MYLFTVYCRSMQRRTHRILRVLRRFFFCCCCLLLYSVYLSDSPVLLKDHQSLKSVDFWISGLRQIIFYLISLFHTFPPNYLTPCFVVHKNLLLFSLFSCLILLFLTVSNLTSELENAKNKPKKSRREKKYMIKKWDNKSLNKLRYLIVFLTFFSPFQSFSLSI